MRFDSFVLTSSMLLCSCVDRGPGPVAKKIDPSYLALHVLREVPASVAVQLGKPSTIGEFVQYMGNRVSTESVIPGEPFTITHYWKVVAVAGPQWRIFSHVRGAKGTSDFYNADASDMRIGYPPTKWKVGDLIEDEQRVTLPPGWKSSTAEIVVGMFQVGKHAIADRAKIVSSDDIAVDSALTVRRLPVDLAKAPPPPGTILVKKAQGPIVIDGIANEAGWMGAAESNEFVGAEGGAEVAGSARAKLTWDDNSLYLFATVVDNDVFSPFKKTDDKLWEADCVEMFVDADGNRSGYIEMQWNPNNARFDSWFTTTRAAPRDDSFDSGAQSAVMVRGTADVAGDSDQGWDVEIAIPWAAVRGKDANMKIHTPPMAGDRWRLNVIRVDKRGQSIIASSWGRIGNEDFHALDRMLTVVFADTPVVTIPAGLTIGEPTVAPAAIEPTIVRPPVPMVAKPMAGSATISPK
jgi:hypothetical protein